MGLDDFAPAGAIPAPTPPTRADSKLDEDLFDFPPMELPHVPAPEVETSEALESNEPVAEAAPASQPAAPKVCTGLDPALDEDLFGFPPMDLSGLGINPDGTLSVELELSIDQAAQSVTDLLEDDLGDIVRDAHKEQQAAVKAQDKPAPAPAAQAAVPAPAPNQGQVQAQVQPPQFAPTNQVPAQGGWSGPSSPKAMWVLTGATVCFMFGLLGIAWRATSSFQQQIQGVREEVQLNNTRLQAATSQNFDDLSKMERDLRDQIKTTQSAGTSGAIEPMARPHDIAMEVARQSIASGRPADARRMLYKLLAEADNHPADTREAMEREASFLIAECHKVEAELQYGGQQ